MNVLVTGAKGFIGGNLCASLGAIRDGYDQRKEFAELLPLTVFACGSNCSEDELDRYAAESDFVFHFAGANRPDDPRTFYEVNRDFTARLLEMLERHSNACPVMLASSVQASLAGRFTNSDYGKSKLAAEQLVYQHGQRMGAKTLIYRLPNVFGKWCRPNYNSAVATFCHNIARGLPITVSDPSTELELLYIDDLVEELLRALLGQEHRSASDFCEALPVHRTTLGQVVELLENFKATRGQTPVPLMAADSLAKKLYSTYLSYLDTADLSYELSAHNDARGTFAEFLRTPEYGQVSICVTKPGMTRGQHWHHSKWEKFLVVSGQGCIRLRRVGIDDEAEPNPIIEYHVSGDTPTVIETVPGYAHSITNESDEHDLVCVIWANEEFDPQHPDTFREEV